ncbi:tRNA1(Val) (adenine(37)-N6)-methyltransferase [Algoriphagus hitonicola]|uniref:tRNA1(Val) (adenine(37)-N6)-methyltransferase n=1 Tax=Algoriphagus hitonicola TaxID=435880 RepID=A0A1I2W6K0_9BACT|nr:methyltransferase [Algoriphagus hitonicola]SFG96247.1 tRNA1Val (adenine37-N6)-methyltransferase [Algoriphagus hitonicola]
MGNSWFDFQQFRVEQDRCAMKISTDAVLLGALVEAIDGDQILDIGTGTGVIALMLAQRFPGSLFTAVELDAEAATQASDNFQKSPFSNRIQLVHGAVQDFRREEKFEVIVSNPPFFPDHLKSIDPQRNRALHTGELSFLDLGKAVSELLKPNGRFFVILPPRQMNELKVVMEKLGLFPFIEFLIRDRSDLPIHREAVGFEFQSGSFSQFPLCLKNDSGAYSDEYKRLISGFLLGY